MPWVADVVSSPVRSPASHDGPRSTAFARSWRRSVEVTRDEVRWAATSPPQALAARTPKRRRQPGQEGDDVLHAGVIDQHLLDDGAEQHGLGHQRKRPDQSDHHRPRPGSDAVAAARRISR